MTSTKANFISYPPPRSVWVQKEALTAVKDSRRTIRTLRSRRDLTAEISRPHHKGHKSKSSSPSPFKASLTLFMPSTPVFQSGVLKTWTAERFDLSGF
ncbi:hypothetical protein ABKV19_024026 [Rosa sericea]